MAKRNDTCVVHCTGHDVYPDVVRSACCSPLHELVDNMDAKEVKALAGNSMHVGTIGTLIAWIISQTSVVSTSIPRGVDEVVPVQDNSDEMPRKKYKPSLEETV